MSVITESFDKVDSITLGPDLAWTQTGAGALAIQSDVLNGNPPAHVISNSSSGEGSARADSDLASKDHYAQCLVKFATNGGAGAGPAVRYAAAADTFYAVLVETIDGGAHYRLTVFKQIAGASTALGSPPDVTALVVQGTYNTIRLEVTGDSPNIVLKSYVDGVLKQTVSGESSIPADNRRCGITGYDPGVNWFIDSFEAGDLAAAGQPAGRRIAKDTPGLAPGSVRRM